jgi:poly-gamma-glutamate capsule biosynthesis protein CapA/YwtB (metallophosphatase superfamily)
MLPSGNVVDFINIDGKELQISICDVANISIFVNAAELGLIGTESASQFNKDTTLIAKCREIRGKGAQIIGMCQDWRLVDEQSPGLPFVTIVAPPAVKSADLNARLTFMNLCHDTIAGTGAICLAACSKIPGSVVEKVMRSSSVEKGVFRILHPEGIMPIWVNAIVSKGLVTEVAFDILAFERTSRRIMDGTIYIPKKVWAGPQISKTKIVPKKTNLLMTGDINLLNVQDSTTPFRQITDHLKAADVVISNLECLLGLPIHSHSIQNEGFFADPTISTEVLRGGNISAVGIANNINYGAANIMASINTLNKAGIAHTGAGENIAAARKPVIVERAGIRYGFLQRTSVYWPTDHAADETGAGIAPLPGHTSYEVLMYRYHSRIPPVNRPGIPPIVTTWVDPEYLAQFTADIKALRPQVDIVVASCHWGLKQEVLTYMEQIAHAAIDAGADVVMGHGPHSPLPVGYHAGKPIFYGLGSFSFHMGHLGMAHGDWVGLLASLSLAKNPQKPEVSFRFARHNDHNETYLCHPGDEQGTFQWLEKASQKHGARLWIEGDSICVEQLEAMI